MLDVSAAVRSIRALRQSADVARSLLVAISGIDGSGKGYVTEQIAGALGSEGVRVAAINLLDGIFLLKAEFRRHYDLAYWVECSFETALQRALRRNQEGLSPSEMIRDYETIYFPAQRIHFERDDPVAYATSVIPNDKNSVEDT